MLNKEYKGKIYHRTESSERDSSLYENLCVIYTLSDRTCFDKY